MHFIFAQSDSWGKQRSMRNNVNVLVGMTSQPSVLDTTLHK